MAKTPKDPDKDGTPAVSGGDILPEKQQHEQPEAPPFESDTTPPEMSGEEAAVLEAEGKVALFEMGEELPDPNEVTDIAPEVSEEGQAPGPISFEAAKAAPLWWTLPRWNRARTPGRSGKSRWPR